MTVDKNLPRNIVDLNIWVVDQKQLYSKNEPLFTFSLVIQDLEKILKMQYGFQGIRLAVQGRCIGCAPSVSALCVPIISICRPSIFKI